MVSSDSEQDFVPRKRQRRHVFKGLVRRLEEVDVGAFADRAPHRLEPAAGASSFAQEELQKWRELDCTADFAELAAALNPLVQSLPQVLHHQAEIFHTLLSKVHMHALLSLDAVLHIMAALARDLQGDFVPFFPTMCSKMSDLISAGASRIPEALQHIFVCLAAVIKTLAKRFAATLPALLQCSRRLRYHRAEYVRSLAAHAFAFPLRHASDQQLMRGIAAVFAEHARKPCEERSHGCGHLLAEAAQGSSHRLHSRAPVVLQLALSHITVEAAQEASLDSAANAQHSGPAAAVLKAMVAKLLDHIRRGSGAALFDSILAHTNEQLSLLDSNTGLLQQQVATAEALSLSSQVIEYFNGSRIDDYSALFQIAAHTSRLPSTDLGDPSNPVASQALRLLLALVRSHARGEKGAATGTAALSSAAPSWTELLRVAPLAEAVQFVQEAVDPWGQGVHAGIARALWEPLLLVLSRGCRSEQHQSACLAALAPICDAVADEVAEMVKSLAGLPDPLVSAPAPAASALSWAAIQCLQHACSSPDEALSVLDACAVQLGDMPATDQAAAVQQGTAVFIPCAIAKLKLACLTAHHSLSADDGSDAGRLRELSALAEQACDLLIRHPTSYHAVSLAAEAVPWAAEDACGAWQGAVEAIMPNLSAPAQELRLATLRLLQHLHSHHASLGSAAHQEGQQHTFTDVYAQWAAIEGRACTLENGRAGAASIAHMQAAIEHEQVPPPLVAPMVRCLLGALYVRFAVLWPPCSAALAMTLAKQASTAWPLVFEALRAAQGDMLASRDASPSAGFPAQAAALPRTAEAWYEAAVHAGTVASGGGCTDASVRLNSLLKALAGTPTGSLERMSHDWVPLFLAFTAAKGHGPSASPLDATGGESIDGAHAAGGNAAASSQMGARVWREQLRVWLAFLGGINGPQRLAHSPLVKRTIASLLTVADSTVQEAALACLKAYKVPALQSSHEQLVQLTKDTGLRGALLAFPFDPSADDSPGPEHRPGLIAVAVRLLWPRMRRRSGRFGGKGAPGSTRAAILNALAALQAAELAPLLLLTVQPLGDLLQPPDVVAEQGPAKEQLAHDGLFVEPWWAQHLGRHDCAWWLAALHLPALASGPPVRACLGFVNAAEDLLQHLGANLQPFLPLLASLVLRLLQYSTSTCSGSSEAVDSTKGTEPGHEAAEGFKELRGGCLRLLAQLWLRFPDAVEWQPLWPAFLALIDRLLPRMEMSAEQVPALLEVVVALASSSNCAQVLDPGYQAPTNVKMSDAADSGHAQPPSFRLLQSAIAGLRAFKCSPASRDAVLTCLEALLDHGSPIVEHVLVPHAEPLADSLRAVILTAAASAESKKRPLQKTRPAKAASVRSVAARALALLERMGPLLLGGRAASALARALLPLLDQAHGPKRKRIDEPMIARILAALTAAWSALSKPDAEGGLDVQGCALALAPLMGSLTDRQCRAAGCAAFAALSQLDAGLGDAAALLTSLDAWSASQLEEPDYDQRLGAYRQLTPTAWGAFPPPAASALLHRCLRDLRDASDLALRHAASQALARFVSAVPVASDNHAQERKQPADASGLGEDDCEVSASSASKQNPLSSTQGMMHLVWRVVYPAIKSNLGVANLAVRQEHVLLLRALIQAVPGSFKQLQGLTDPDPEADFFHNVAHLQLHRRSRALARLSRALEQGQLGPSAILAVITPLLHQSLVGVRGQEGMPHKRKKQADSDKQKGQDAALAESAVQAVKAAAAVLEWAHYRQLLGRFLRLLAHQRDGSDGPALRAVCAIVDAFHFCPGVDGASPACPDPHRQATDSAKGSDAAAQAAPASSLALPMAAPAASVQPHDAPNQPSPLRAADANDVSNTLAHKVVPVLEGAMKARGGEVVRAPVALALVKLVRHLQPEAARALLPRTLQGVANMLRSRLQRIRDDARAVLLSMAAELGPDYLPFVIDVLQSALPNRGYTAHVLGFTLHSVLAAVARAHSQAGMLDEVAERVLAILGDQLFGVVAEEKEVAAVAGALREAKRTRSYDSYEVLARCTTLRTHLAMLLGLVEEHLPEAGSGSVRAKLETLLAAAAKGIAANPSSTPQDVLVFVHGVLSDAAADDRAAKKRLKAAGQGVNGTIHDSEAKADSSPERQHRWLLAVFALTLLHRGMRKGDLGARTGDNLAMLDGLLGPVAAAFKSRHTPVASLALRCLALLLSLPLPGLAAVAPSAGEGAIRLLRKAGSASDALAQEAFKLLAAFLRTCPAYQPSTAQLRFLVQWGLGELEEAASHTGAFTLLRALIGRRIVLPEVYDVIIRIQELMVRCQVTPMRELCSSVLLQFLLDYPLATRRLQQHLHFLLANLGFEHAGGRQAAASTLRALCLKLPPPLLDTWAPTFFLPLLAQLVSEDDSACRGELSTAVLALFQRASPKAVDRLSAWCQQWLGGGEGEALGRAAAQAAALQAQAEGALFARRVSGLLPALLTVLGADGQEQDADDEDIGRVSWQHVYAALVLLEKIMARAPAALQWEQGDSVQQVWVAVSCHVLHPHVWVRGIAARLLGLAFADDAIGEGLLSGPPLGPAPGSLALSLFKAFAAEEAGDALRTQAVRCLVFLAPRLAQGAPVLQPRQEDASADVAASTDALEPTDGLDAFDDDDDDDDDGVESDDEDPDKHHAAGKHTQLAGTGGASGGAVTLQGLVRRMARVAGSRLVAQQGARLTALRFTAALASRLSPEQLRGCLPLVLPPVFRAEEAGASEAPEVRELVGEVVQHLRAVAGPEEVALAYSRARTAVLQARTNRRRSQAMQAMVDPEAAAQARMRKQQRHAGARKRKAAQHARHRAAASYAPKRARSLHGGGRKQSSQRV